MLLASSLSIWGANMFSFLSTIIAIFIIWIILLIFSSLNRHWKIKHLTEKQTIYLEYVRNERKDRYTKLNWALFISLMFGIFFMMIQLNLTPIIVNDLFPIHNLDLYIGWGLYGAWVFLTIIAILNILYSGRNICNANMKMKDSMDEEEFKYYVSNYINKVKVKELGK
ncbi:hypothetical protein [Mesoplasma coleopterae]|uniref:Uncharacterized protein n=1 Tax=Mesoplasma coleopterae TaxID=324078 RepID=A0A2K8P5F0_9MOLU|nr:hypothetical protein [Mesoplasma coleopterae]ATZ20963.1 hypothetical protein MCOLE_v1c04510 [Mesoplasma coleopterae]